MASFTNRSRYLVTVANRADLCRAFPFNKTKLAEAYLQALRDRGFKPKLGQAENVIEVRIRTTGYADLHFTAASYDEAERSANHIEGERSRGLFIDYTKSMNVTVAQLIRRFIIEECPKHRSCEVDTYALNSMLGDAGAEPVAYEEQQHGNAPKARPRNSTGQQVHKTIANLEWMHKPFGLVEPTDIEEYIRDRLESVSPATVDRELDRLSAVINVAIHTWRYHVAHSPMHGVRRPRYFNERDRRLVGDEEARLLAAAREEDRLRCIELRLSQLLADAREQASKAGSASTRKRILAVARERYRPEAERTAVQVPLYETLVAFQLATAARRGESLALEWQHVLPEGRYVFFPETKNGRPRKVPLRRDLLVALERLPRDDRRVFPITANQLRDAWARICTRAGVADFHVHDCRHEALSRIAETGKFTLLDLQAISGHRDPRMLMRYAHLCVKKLADRLDQAFSAPEVPVHKGRRRLGRHATVKLRDVVNHSVDAVAPAPLAVEGGRSQEEPASRNWPNNVVPFCRTRRRQVVG